MARGAKKPLSFFIVDVRHLFTIIANQRCSSTFPARSGVFITVHMHKAIAVWTVARERIFFETLTDICCCFRRRSSVCAVHSSWHAIRRPERIANNGQHPRRRSTRAGSRQADPGLFFEPVKFHLQLADLAVQQFRLPMRSHWLGTALAFKQGAGLLLDFLLPLPNLDWMNPVLLTDLVDRLHPAQRFQTHLGLELRTVILPRLCFSHYVLPLMTASSLNRCLENGGHYTLPAAWQRQRGIALVTPVSWSSDQTWRSPPVRR